MFEFLGNSEIVHLVEHFMHRWHNIDEQEETIKKRRNRDFDIRMKKIKEQLDDEIDDRREKLRKKYEGELKQAAKAQDEARMAAKMAPTIEDLSATLKIGKDRIKRALVEAEEEVDLVHLPNPHNPEMTQFALREFVEKAGLQNWQPGTGF